VDQDVKKILSDCQITRMWMSDVSIGTTVQSGKDGGSDDQRKKQMEREKEEVERDRSRQGRERHRDRSAMSVSESERHTCGRK
jgi:hypothetical protein